MLAEIKMSKQGPFCFLVALLLLAGGCATVSPQAGAKLADAGVETASTTKNTIKDTRLGLETYIQGLYLQAALRGTAPPDTPTQAGTSTLDQVEKIKKMLAARESVLTDLVNTYSSFGALAKSNFAQDLPKEMEKLGSAINGYAQAVGAEPVIPAEAQNLASRVTGILAQFFLSQKLKQCSVVIKEQLIRFNNLFLREKQDILDLRRDMAKESSRIMEELWKRGLGQPHPILRPFLEDSGLDYDEPRVNLWLEGKAPPELKMSPDDVRKVKDAILNVVKRRSKLKHELQDQIIGRTESSLKELIKAHDNFEKGQPLGLDQLTQHLNELREILDLIKQLRGGAKS